MSNSSNTPFIPLQDLLESSFSSLFHQAESAIKDIEISDRELIIAAVNELRYAGYHIANLISQPDQAEELTKAENHCKRAIYDAYEAHIIFLVFEFKTFKTDYSNTIISNIIPKYSEYRKQANTIISFIKNTDKETKAEHYEKCRIYSSQLKDIVDELDAARDELNKQIRKERRTTQLLVLSIVVAIASIFITCICK